MTGKKNKSGYQNSGDIKTKDGRRCDSETGDGRESDRKKNAPVKPKDLKPSKSVQRGKVIDTLILERPILRDLQPGFSLGIDNIPQNIGEYFFPWNARSFANKQSTHFSSFKLAEGLEKHVGAVDFVSDWENIKKLMKSTVSSDSLSFIVHRIGNSLLVDELDLRDIIMNVPYKSTSNWFHDYVKGIVGPHKENIKAEGKSNREVIGKGIFHKLLYCSLDQGQTMKFKTDYEVPNSNLIKEELLTSQLSIPHNTKIPLQGSNENFLHRVTWNFDKYSILVGSNIPLYKRNTRIMTSVTLRSYDAINSEKIDRLTGFDMWLDNVLLDVPETYLVHQKDESIKLTQWMRTEDFPQNSGFDSDKVFNGGRNAFDFLKSHALITGHTYWFFKPPGAEFKMYDLTALSDCKKNGLEKTKCPFTTPCATLLYRTLCTHMDIDVKTKSPDTILNDTINLFDSKFNDKEISVSSTVQNLISEMAVGKLFNAAILMTSSFNCPPDSLYDKKCRRDWVVKLSNSVQLYEGTFERLVKSSSPNMAAIIATVMSGLYSLFEETYSNCSAAIESGRKMSLSGVFQCITRCLNKALELDIANENLECPDLCTLTQDTKGNPWRILELPVRPQPLYDTLVWMLSSVLLKHAKHLLEYYPQPTDLPSKICNNAYELITTLLKDALKFKNDKKPLVYPTSNERKKRIAEINFMLGTLHKNQVYLIMKNQAVEKHMTCCGRWEPIIPDVIFCQKQTENLKFKPRPFTYDSDIEGFKWPSSILDLVQRAMLEFQDICNETEDPFESLINFINIMDLKLVRKHVTPQSLSLVERLSELNCFKTLLVYLLSLNDKLDDDQNQDYKTEFDVNSRTYYPRSDCWRKSLGSDYVEDSAPFLVILRICVRVLYDLPSVLTFGGERPEVKSTENCMNKIRQLLLPYKDEEQRSAKTVLGVKTYLGFQYRTGKREYSDFMALLNGLIQNLKAIMKIDFAWVDGYSSNDSINFSKKMHFQEAGDVNASYYPHNTSSAEAYKKNCKSIDTALNNQTCEIPMPGAIHFGTGDGDLQGFHTSPALSVYKNSKLKKENRDQILKADSKDNQMADNVTKTKPSPKLNDTSDTSISEKSSNKNLNSNSKATKSKKLGKGEKQYIVEDNNIPYDMDKIVESFSTIGKTIAQNRNDTKSKKNKNPGKQIYNEEETEASLGDGRRTVTDAVEILSNICSPVATDTEPFMITPKLDPQEQEREEKNECLNVKTTEPVIIVGSSKMEASENYTKLEAFKNSDGANVEDKENNKPNSESHQICAPPPGPDHDYANNTLQNGTSGIGMLLQPKNKKHKNKRKKKQNN